MSILRLPTHRQVAFPLPFASFHDIAGWSAVLLGEVADHFLNCALVDFRIKRPGKQEYLLSWPFLGDIPEATWIGDRQSSNLLCHVQQIFVASHQHIGAGCQSRGEHPAVSFIASWKR